MRKFLLCIGIAGSVSSAFAQSAAPASDTPPFDFNSRVSGTDLATITGQADTAMVIRAQNSGTVAGNSVSGHSETGRIVFDGQSFEGLNGLSLLSANTGNNVSINSSLNVNVSIQR